MRYIYHSTDRFPASPQHLQDFFFREDSKIYSKAQDLPPAKFNVGSGVKNSLIGSGCIINSYVENSVIFKRVFIGNNSTVKNSIIMRGVAIGENAELSYIISDKYASFSDRTVLTGNAKLPTVVRKGSVI